MREKKRLIGFFALVIAIFYVFAFVSEQEPNIGNAASSPDAIAVRIIPNPKHYSPARWYSNQNFSGSPQSITVDGYDAVRDGRTVYVSVANIVDTNSDGKNDKLYTNIYLISYSQSAENNTVDIFGQILQHWKFNVNIGKIGSCSKTVDRTCANTSECAMGEYCISPKSKIVRDTRRLADFVDLQISLEAYKSSKGYYPKISSGSYLSNKTISVWPSWQSSLGGVLGAKLPVDPINKLGDCGGDGYDPTTCWDEAAKRFADPEPADADLDMPEGSNVYIYSVTPDGSSMSLSMGTESGRLDGDGNFIYDNDDGGSNSYTNINTATGNQDVSTTEVTGLNIAEGYSGKEYAGYLQADTLSSNILTWKIEKITYQHDESEAASTWTEGSGKTAEEFLTGRDCLWDSPELLGKTGVEKQRKLYAKKMGKAGTYVFTASIDENNGTAPVLQDFSFIVKNTPPITYSLKSSKTMIIGHDLDYVVIKATDDTKYDHYPMAFSISAADAGAPELKCKQNPAVSCEQAEDKASCGSELDGSYQCHIEKGTVVADTKEYSYTIVTSDYYGEQTSNTFRLTLTNDVPDYNSIKLDNDVATIGCPFKANIVASDNVSDGHSITEWLSSDLSSKLAGATLDSGTGALYWPSAGAGNASFQATVRDQYYSRTLSPNGAETTRTLTVAPQEFNILSISNAGIYNYPASYAPAWNDGSHPLYHVAGYAGQAAVTIPGDVAYTLESPSPTSWLSIDGTTGAIQGTPVSTIATGVQDNFTVKVRATKNPCGIYKETSYNISVNQNEWCGDSIRQDGYEACDFGSKNDGSTQISFVTAANDSNHQYACKTDCTWAGGYCGDGTLQSSYGEACDTGASTGVATGPVYDNANHTYSYCGNTCHTVTGNNYYCGDNTKNGSEKCDGSGGGGTSADDQYSCTSSCTWTGGYYGDGTINGPEQCDGTNFGGKTCATYGYDTGSLTCSNGTIGYDSCDKYLTGGIHTAKQCVSAGGSVVDSAGNSTSNTGAVFCRMPYTRDTCAAAGMTYYFSSYDGYEICQLPVIGSNCYACDDGMDCCDNIYDTSVCTSIGGYANVGSTYGDCYLNYGAAHCSGGWTKYGNWTTQSDVYSRSCGSNCYDHGCFNNQCGGMCHGWSNFFTYDYYNYCDHSSYWLSFNGVSEIGCY